MYETFVYFNSKLVRLLNSPKDKNTDKLLILILRKTVLLLEWVMHKNFL